MNIKFNNKIEENNMNKQNIIKTDNVDEFLEWKKENCHCHIKPRSKREYKRKQKIAYAQKIKNGEAFVVIDNDVVKNNIIIKEWLKHLDYSLAVTFNFNREVPNGNITKRIAKNMITIFNSHYPSLFVSSTWYKKWKLQVIFTYENENSNLHCHCFYIITNIKTNKLEKLNDDFIKKLNELGNMYFRNAISSRGTFLAEKPYEIDLENKRYYNWGDYSSKAFSNSKDNTDRIDYI